MTAHRRASAAARATERERRKKDDIKLGRAEALSLPPGGAPSIPVTGVPPHDQWDRDLVAGEAASLIAQDLLVAMYCPPSVASTVTVTAPAFHPAAPPATMPLSSTIPMATTAPSSCGSNLAFRLGRNKVLCAFYFLFLCILNQPCKQATIGFRMNKNGFYAVERKELLLKT